jgi:hypothetical protein
VEFLQSLLFVPLHQKKIGRFPGHVRRGGIGLNGMLQRRGLIRDVTQHLVSRGQIEPVTGGVRIKLDGGAVGLDCGAWISGYQRVISP